MNKNNGITFKNFRRFKDFPYIEFGEVNFLVGRNNSGKSTMVKAKLLILDYLQNQLENTFSFDNDILKDSNIITFGRALNIENDVEVIEIEITLDGFDFKVSMTGKNDDTKASVNYLTINDPKDGIKLEINFNYNIATFTRKESKNNQDIESIYLKIKQLKYELEKTQNEITELEKNNSDKNRILIKNDRKNRYLSQIDSLKKQISKNKSKETFYEISVDLPLKSKDYNSKNNQEIDEYLYATDTLFEHIINDIIGEIYRKHKRSSSDSKKSEDSVAYQDIDNIKFWTDSVSEIISMNNYRYIKAGIRKNSTIFQIKDPDSLSEAIHIFKSNKLNRNPIANAFIKKWLLKFDIGQDFRIDLIAGEVYTFKIINNGYEQHLADYGTGSIQVLNILLHIAISLYAKKEKVNRGFIFIEEPELNLHPAHQSLICDLFHDVSKQGVKFMVETHSEYMIRKSQVIVGKGSYHQDDYPDENPFMVYYFPIEDGDMPYRMEYRNDGKFSNEFRSGFFDISSDLAFDIL